MNKLIKKIDYFINKYTNLKFDEEEKLKFLLEIDFNNLISYDNVVIIKILYYCFSKNNSSLIDEYLKEMDGFNKISSKQDYCNYMDMVHFFNQCTEEDFDKLFIDCRDYEEKLKRFNELNYSKNVRNLIIKITKTNDKINFDKYNLFLSFFNDKSKIGLMEFLEDILILRQEKKDPTSVEDIEYVIDVILKDYNYVINQIKNKIKKIQDEYRKFNKSRIKKLELYKELKNNIIYKREINIDNLEINDKLLIEILEYNNNLINDFYNKEIILNKELNKEEINNKDKILNKFDVKINANKVIVSDKELEKKLIYIDDFLKEVKKYNNILLMLINLDLNTFNILIKLINNKEINYEYILDNIEYLYDKELLNNFIYNIKIFKENNIKINNVIKYDDSILIYDYKKIKNNINIYKSYNIKLDKDIYNFEFLKKDYSYIIDKFIEIGEYNLIINNPNLINDNSINIIKRCSIYKDINNNCLNEQQKLKGNLRREDKFIVSDEILDEIVIENYDELINNDILKILNDDNNFISDYYIDLNILNKFIENDKVYNIKGFYISKNKIIKCMKKLLNSNKKTYDFNKLIFFSILYNYPKLIRLNDINKIKKELNIEEKTLIKK